MKPTIRLIFLLSLVLIMWSAACGPKDKVIKPEYPATIEEIDGVRTVHNPGYSPERGHPEFYPAFSDWRKFFDEKGNLWLEQYPIDDVEEHVFDVFSPDGIYLRKVIVPEVLFDVKGDTAYGFVRDEEDYVLFKRYKMVLVEGDN